MGILVSVPEPDSDQAPEQQAPTAVPDNDNVAAEAGLEADDEPMEEDTENGKEGDPEVPMRSSSTLLIVDGSGQLLGEPPLLNPGFGVTVTSPQRLESVADLQLLQPLRSGSAFVQLDPLMMRVKNGGGGGGGGGLRGRPPLPFNFGPGGPFGSGDDGPKPEDVPDSFKLEMVGGLEDQIGYLKRSIILPLARPEVLREWGVTAPRGILLHGPPGTGKTFLAKALVNELKKHLGQKVSFFYRKGGDVFTMWFGESQRKLREIFEAAHNHAPSVIFFDEIDGLCPSREKMNVGSDAYNSVVTCFLGQMDAVENGKVFVVGATNRLDAVDPAVRRPGRFDKHLAFGFPDAEARQKILQIHTSRWANEDKPSEGVIKTVAARASGFSGADLEKLCKDVVYVAMEENGGQITDDMKITEAHWLKAMGSMTRTAAGSFGSAIYIPQRPTEVVELLTKPLVARVMEMMAPMLSQASFEVTPTYQKSFLLHLLPHQSKSFLTSQILPSILTSPSLKKWSIFELSPSLVTTRVLQGHHPTIFGAIQHVLSQAISASSEQPVILFAPNLNELLELSKANHIPDSMVLQGLGQICGPRMLLLATSSVPPDQVQAKVPNFRALFNWPRRQLHAANPTCAELKSFFAEVMRRKLDGLPERQVPEEIKVVMQGAMQKAAECADNRNYEEVLGLWGNLNEVPVDKIEGLRGRYDEVIKSFNNFGRK